MPSSHLAIEINNGAVRFSKLNGSFVLDKFEYAFKDQLDYRYKQQLDEFLAESGLKEMDFDDVSVAWSSKEATLVPANVFSETTKEAVFELCYGQDFDKNDIDHNRIFEMSVVNVFSLPTWLKSYFVIRFPRVVIQHEVTHLIRGIFAGSTFKLKTFVVLHNDFFYLSIVKENKLLFFSTFEYATIEDLIYYISFTLQQKNLALEDQEIVLCSGVGTQLILPELDEKLTKIVGKSVKITSDSMLITNFQKLCV